MIVVPGLWERTSDPRVRSQVVLFNLATVITVTLGIVSLYAVLFLLILAGAGLVTGPETFAQVVGRDVGFADYATLAWYVASLATLGGALGSALESEDAVRAAAYRLPRQSETTPRRPRHDLTTCFRDTERARRKWSPSRPCAGRDRAHNRSRGPLSSDASSVYPAPAECNHTRGGPGPRPRGNDRRGFG